MKIEFYNKESGVPEFFQEDFVVDSEGWVFEHCDHAIYGWGYHRNFNVSWRTVE